MISDVKVLVQASRLDGSMFQRHAASTKDLLKKSVHFILPVKTSR
jgi:hypothetical protein